MCFRGHIASVEFETPKASRGGRPLAGARPLPCLPRAPALAGGPLWPPLAQALTQRCSKMNPGNQSVLGSKDHRSRSRVTKTLQSWVFALVWLLAASSYVTENNFSSYRETARYLRRCVGYKGCILPYL